MNHDANERAKTSVRTLGDHRIARFALALSLPLKYTFPHFSYFCHQLIRYLHSYYRLRNGSILPIQ